MMKFFFNSKSFFNVVFIYLLFILLSANVINGESSCSNNGTPLGAGQCLCYEGYTGNECNTTCSGHGTQNVLGHCQCLTHYSGLNCEIQCHGHGIVNLAGSCECNSGYTGEDCSIPCNNHGHLDEQGNCVCDIGWADRYCLTSCGGHGTYRGSSCVCELRYAKPNCTKLCNEKGIIHPDYGFCVCFPGFSGTACDVECSGNGRVVQNVCRCNRPEFSGSLCEVVCNGNGNFTGSGCSCNNRNLTDPYCFTEVLPCSGRGNLTNGTCVCPTGWSGSNCENRTLDCVHGVAVGNVCRCDDGFSGSRCQLECSGHGQYNRTLKHCECLSHYSGKLCEIECSGNGVISDPMNGSEIYSCSCRQYFTGSDCEIECSSQGSVITINNTTQCSCKNGYIGLNCSTPCSGHGTLINYSNNETLCSCSQFFTGEYCNETCNGLGDVVNGKCSCPALLGKNCNALCSDVGYVRVDISGSHPFKFIFPNLTVDKIKSVVKSSSRSLTSTELVRELLLANWPLTNTPRPQSNWTVSRAECRCMSDVYSGSVCEIECDNNGTSYRASGSDISPDLIYRFEDCRSGVETVENCLRQRDAEDDPFRCQCLPNFGSVDSLHCYNCSRHGKLTNGSCVCDEGYSGSSCQLPCSGNGYEHLDGECVCNDPHITGIHCEFACDWLCKGGTCSGENCTCKENYSGKWCDELCYESSSGGRICDQVVDRQETPYSRSWRSFIRVTGTILASLICVGLAFLLFHYYCIRRRVVLKKMIAENRSRYMRSQRLADQDEQAGISLESYHPHPGLIGDERIETKKSFYSDDENEIDLHSEQFRST